MKKKQLIVFITLVAMLALPWHGQVFAEMPTLREISTVVGDSMVLYPQLTGLKNKAVQQRINDEIVLRSDIARHLITLSTLSAGGLGLIVNYETYMNNDILSVTVNAKGQMTSGREGQAYTALAYDLETGVTITAEDLFIDMVRAVAYMEDRAVDTMTDEISGYLEHSDLIPFPVENFALDEDGITFYYPSSQLQLLSGYSGACQFYYWELDALINWNGIINKLQVQPTAYSAAEAKEKIIEIVKSGHLPNVPVAIGEKMTDVRNKYRVLREPDQYPGGKYYQFEASVFRQIYVLSDVFSGSDPNSIVQGLQSARTNLFGIKTGETTREEWRAILGVPDSTVVFDESLAYDYSIPIGESDFYVYGECQLRLHADLSDILQVIRISK